MATHAMQACRLTVARERELDDLATLENLDNSGRDLLDVVESLARHHMGHRLENGDVYTRFDKVTRSGRSLEINCSSGRKGAAGDIFDVTTGAAVGHIGLNTHPSSSFATSWWSPPTEVGVVPVAVGEVEVGEVEVVGAGVGLSVAAGEAEGVAGADKECGVGGSGGSFAVEPAPIPQAVTATTSHAAGSTARRLVTDRNNPGGATARSGPCGQPPLRLAPSPADRRLTRKSDREREAEHGRRDRCSRAGAAPRRA